MDNTTPIPTSLKVVAFLFILSGIFSIIEIIVSLMHNSISINFGALILFVGLGLLRLSRGWRTCALALLWLAMVSTPLFAIFVIATSEPIDFNLFGQKIGHASKVFVIVSVAPIFALEVWQYRVLTRPDVRRLFEVPDA